MSRILELRKLLATEPNPEIKAGYKREIASLTNTSRSAMKKRGTRLAQTMMKSDVPWVNLDDDYPVVMDDDGTWKYVAAGDEGGTPYFVGFDDHTASGVIVYAGDEEAAEEIAAEAILAANPNYFQDENSFMEENGVDVNSVDWDKTSNDEIVGQHGGTMIYINGAGYVSTTGSPTVRRLKRPSPPKAEVDALAKVKAAATEFSTKYADQLKGNIVGTSYLSRDLRYFLGTQGKDERDELIDSLEKSIAFEQKFQGDPEEAGPSDFLPDAQALLSALKAFGFPSEGAGKAAKPAMHKGETFDVFFSRLDRKGKKGAQAHAQALWDESKSKHGDSPMFETQIRGQLKMLSVNFPEEYKALLGIAQDNGMKIDTSQGIRLSSRPAMRKRAYPGKVGDFIEVSQVPDEAEFISDSQDVDAVRELVGPDAQGYDSFFVIVGDGDYDAVWGMYGIVPNDDKQVARVV